MLPVLFPNGISEKSVTSLSVCCLLKQRVTGVCSRKFMDAKEAGRVFLPSGGGENSVSQEGGL